jgi:tetratricopeptide (TPR) repeat protein
MVLSAQLVRVVRVVAVSPGDVRAERNRLEVVVDELNRGIARERGCRLSLWRWETDAHPGLHLEGPQGLIDDAMGIDDSDVVVGIFWKRFGTPTSDAGSGTEHELRRAWSAWQQRRRPQVMVYFCDRKHLPRDTAEAAQLQQLLSFREALPNEQLWWRYVTVADFERSVRQHLTAFLLALKPVTAPAEVAHGSERQPESRRLVSVLAVRADIGDPEVMHGVFDRCTSVIEQHGGTVERYLGDALVGLFGLIESHGDEALRAARAASELRLARSDLRLGIETGEVFLGAGPHGATIATGSTITAAGHLADRAVQGEILLGNEIRGVVASAAHVDPSGRLLELHAETPGVLREAATPFVGRTRELDELQRAFQVACDESACRLVTVAGPAGIGKSRLAGEFLASIPADTHVLVGRCLAYGEGTTYRALADIVRGLGDDPRQLVTELLENDEQAIRGLLGAIGLIPEWAQAEETAWATRRLLERLARDRPVLMCIEDLHWAEPALLGVVDHVAALSIGAPILILCLTRPELLHSHPEWAALQPTREIITLGALGETQAGELAQRLGAGSNAAQIARRAEGNPLFVEQLVAVDTGEETGQLPVTIHAVLAARIDRLQPDEKLVLQRASLEGRFFHSGTLAALLPERLRHNISAHLVALISKGFIAPDRPEFAGQEAFRFTHQLIREVSYAGVPKLLRAKLHALVAEWLEEHSDAADEIVGYHFEQACLLATELGYEGEREQDLAARGAGHLEAAARAALARADPSTAITLLERAVTLVEPDEAARGTVLPTLGMALFEAGRMTDAAQVLDEAIVQATEPRLEARARIEREFVRLGSETGVDTGQACTVAAAVCPVLERERDTQGQSRLWALRASVAWSRGHVTEADDAWRRAADYAQRAGDERDLFNAFAWRATAAVLGPMPVAEGIQRCFEFRDAVSASPVGVAWMINPLAPLYAMSGDMKRAERFLREAKDILRELGSVDSTPPHLEAFMRLIAGQPGLAETPLREGMDALRAMSATGLLATTIALLAQSVYAQGRLVEAEALCRETCSIASRDDILTQAIWRSVLAKNLSRHGQLDEAVALAREAVAILAPTDLLWPRGDAMLDLAEVLRASRLTDEANDAVRAGLVLYERKGNVVSAARAASLL